MERVCNEPCVLNPDHVYSANLIYQRNHKPNDLIPTTSLIMFVMTPLSPSAREKERRLWHRSVLLRFTRKNMDMTNVGTANTKGCSGRRNNKL